MPESKRVSRGVPAGGQYTPNVKPDAFVDLFAPDIDENGTMRWLQYDALHRTDGPAVIFADGTEVWHYDGEVHRDGDMPAITTSTGERRHYRYGALHRDGDKPAVKYADGAVEHWTRGELNRDGGLPAVIRPDGHTEWRVKGKLHRPVAYGPALILPDGRQRFFENGVEISEGGQP
jgi:hypothetical protein